MAGPELTVLMDAIDLTGVAEALISVAAMVVGVYLALKGAKMVIRAVAGGEYLNNAGEAYSGRQLDRLWNEMDSAERNDWGFASKDDFLDMFQRVK